MRHTLEFIESLMDYYDHIGGCFYFKKGNIFNLKKYDIATNYLYFNEGKPNKEYLLDVEYAKAKKYKEEIDKKDIDEVNDKGHTIFNPFHKD
jgi:hypothetical protein